MCTYCKYVFTPTQILMSVKKTRVRMVPPVTTYWLSTRALVH